MPAGSVSVHSFTEGPGGAAPRAGTRFKPVATSAMPEKMSFPPDVVPTRRLYERPLEGVSASVAESQEKVTSYGPAPATAAARPEGAAGGVLKTPPLLR